MVKEGKDRSTEEKIFAAARSVFLKKGMAGARMQDIADEAGINKAMLHYYFRTKEKLFEMIFREATASFFPKIEGIIGSDISLPEKIRSFCGAYIDMASRTPFLPMFVLSEANLQPKRFRQHFWKNREFFYKRFTGDLKAEMKKGNIRRVDPDQLLLNMFSMCIFPFLAKPIWMMSTGAGETQFRAMMEERKTVVPQFIIDSIKN